MRQRMPRGRDWIGVATALIVLGIALYLLAAERQCKQSRCRVGKPLLVVPGAMCICVEEALP
jgi:hypothetical protein